jgi:hypothetical protein
MAHLNSAIFASADRTPEKDRIFESMSKFMKRTKLILRPAAPEAATNENSAPPLWQGPASADWMPKKGQK